MCPDGRIRRIDLAYPQAKLGIEVDGFRWHSGRKAFDDDRRQRNMLVAIGWTILHATKQDVDEACLGLVETTRAVLAGLSPELPFERGDD
jgi:very-short-patch-repair endonuclease